MEDGLQTLRNGGIMSKTQPIKNKKQLEKFRNYYRTGDYHPRNHALIVFGLNSALRIGDILGLRWMDVYHNHRYRDHIVLCEQKTGKEKYIALNHAAKEALEFYRKTIDDFQEDRYIFISQKQKEKPITRSQAFRIIRNAAIECHVEHPEHISCHSLRKTFGYYAWKTGTPPALLMSIYNHSSYDITKRYLCIDQIEQDYVYQNLSL